MGKGGKIREKYIKKFDMITKMVIMNDLAVDNAYELKSDDGDRL